MTKRQELQKQFNENENKITNLEAENLSLEREMFLLCDEEQWFTEVTETDTVYVDRKSIKKETLVGRIHWKEEFKDEDGGESVFVERSRVVRVNNSWEW